MKISDFKGFMVGAFVVASSLSVLAVVQIPNVFKPGDLITADGMNQNFSSLKAGIDALEASVTAKQNRVSGTCAVGSSIRVVNTDGTVECQLDNGGSGGSSYSAGAGLKLAGTQFSVDTTTVQSRVAGVCAAGSAIKEVKADGQVVCEAVGNTGGGVAGVSAVNGKTVSASSLAAPI
jgi:competence protein ComGC